MSITGALVLAAGKGTRMHSVRPKVMRELLGEPMLQYVLRSIGECLGERIWVVVGHGAKIVEEAFPGLAYIMQQVQLGTGHALAESLPALQDAGLDRVLVINGDCPLADPATIRRFMTEADGADLAFASIVCQDPADYGRVVRKDGKVSAIVEARDYREEVHGPLTGEINAGLYLIAVDAAKRLVPRLGNRNSSSEYYITDLVQLALADGLKVRGVECGDNKNLLGVNSPAELIAAEEMLRARTVDRLLADGVVIHAPALARICPFSIVEPGSELTGPCEIYGRSVVEHGAVIHSNCRIANSRIESGAEIRSFCDISGAIVRHGALVGPFARLRPGSELQADSHVGNFVELKNSTLGMGAKANHLSYLGDASIGERANIGAGTITCNYDGKHKYRTSIGDEAFIGSNTSLVAPVQIGNGALVGAGSVITRDVPEGKLAIARPGQKTLPLRKK